MSKLGLISVFDPSVETLENIKGKCIGSVDAILMKPKFVYRSQARDFFFRYAAQNPKADPYHSTGVEGSVAGGLQIKRPTETRKTRCFWRVTVLEILEISLLLEKGFIVRGS